MFVDPYVDIAVVCVVLALISQAIQAKFVNTPEVKEARERSKEKNKRMRELMKKTDDESVQEMKKIQKEIMDDTMASMKTMHYAFLTLPLYLVVFGYFGGSSVPFVGGLFGNGAYTDVVFNLPVALPWIDFQFHETTNWLGYYFVWIMLSTIVIKLGLTVFERMKKKKEEEMEEKKEGIEEEK